MTVIKALLSALDYIPPENWEHGIADLICSLGAAIKGGKRGEVLRISGLGDCIPVRSGRAALLVAIKALALSPGSCIGVPLYCCPVVFGAVAAAGCSLRFIDVDPKSYCISAEDLSAKSSKLDAVIAVHMFGNPCNMNGVRDAMQGKPIIEDCAQSIGSRIGTSMVGSFGTVAFFSFRSGKYLSVGEGGALLSQDRDLQARAAQIIGEMPVPSRRRECLHIASTYLRSILRSRPLYGPIGYPLWSYYNTTAGYSQKSKLTAGRMFASDLAIAAKRFAFLDSDIQAQRAIADFYTQNLDIDASMLCSEMPGMFYNRYHYPISFPSPESREQIAAYLHQNGIGTIKAYCNVKSVAANYYGYRGDCPAAERIAESTLVIPSHHRLKKRDLRRVAQFLNAGYREYLNRG
jgi:perosamine synthetase